MIVACVSAVIVVLLCLWMWMLATMCNQHVEAANRMLARSDMRCDVFTEQIEALRHEHDKDIGEWRIELDEANDSIEFWRQKFETVERERKSLSEQLSRRVNQ